MMIKIGVPAGLQGCLFSLSNVLIQSSINSFGGMVVDGNSIAMQLDGFIFSAMNAVSLSSLAFVSQNLGANNYERVKKTIWCGINKINVNSDLQAEWYKEVCEFIKNNSSVYDPRKVISSGRSAIYQLIEDKINIMK